MKILLALVFALSCFTSSIAKADRVELIGVTDITNNPDRDVIEVRSCAADNEKVSAIKIRVLGDDARIDLLKVVYGNGTKEILSVRSNFRQGSESRWIDLANGARCIDRIVIRGQSSFRNRPSRVQVWGITKNRR